MLKIDIEPVRGILFVRLSGKLDKGNVKKFNNDVTRLLKGAGIKNIVFNINELDYIDKAGENALIDNFNICLRNQGQGFICISESKKNLLNFNDLNFKFINDELTAVKLINV